MEEGKLNLEPLDLEPVDEKLDLEPLDLTPLEGDEKKKPEQPSLMGVNLPSPLASESGTSVLEAGKSGQVNPIKDLSAVKQNIKNLFLDTEDKTYDNPKYRDSFYKSLETSGHYSPSEVNEIKNYGEDISRSKTDLVQADQEAVNLDKQLKFVQEAKKQRESNKESDDYKALDQEEKDLKSRFRDAGYKLGISQIKMGDSQKAVNTLLGALSNEYKQPVFTQGSTDAQTNEGRVYQKASPASDSNILYSLGYANQKMGDEQAASEYYTEALKKNPKNELAYKALGYQAKAKGDQQAAKELLRASEQVKAEKQHTDELAAEELHTVQHDEEKNLRTKALEKMVDDFSKGEGPVFGLFNPFSNFAHSFGEGVETVGEGVKNKDAAETMAGLFKTGFSALRVLPSTAAGMETFEVGTAVAQSVLPQEALGWAMSPVSTAMQHISPTASKTDMSGAELADIVYQFLLFHGAGKISGKLGGAFKTISESPDELKSLAEKFKNNEPVPKDQFNQVLDVMANATPEELKQAIKATAIEPKLPDHIVELQNKLTKAQQAFDKAPNEQVAAVHEKTVSALQDKLAEEGAKMDEENFKAAHSDATALKIQDDISALKEGLKGEEDQDLIAGIENEIGNLEKMLPARNVPNESVTNLENYVSDKPNGSEDLARDVADRLKQIGFNLSGNISTSESKYGISHYVIATDNNGNNYKFRISNHSVENSSRMNDEYHINNENIGKQIIKAEQKAFPERFKESNEIYVSKNDLNSDDEIISTKINKSGHEVYLVKRNGEKGIIKRKEVQAARISDADIEKRMLDIQETNPSFDSKEQTEFNNLEKEMEKRERESVFGAPLENAKDAIDSLLKKEREQPNGFGSFIEKRDASESKTVIEKYLDPEKVSDGELKKDFKDALMGNPSTWYADGLKLRETTNLATKRGINFGEMLKIVEDEFVKYGYDIQKAKEVIAGYLEPLLPKKNTENKKITTLVEGKHENNENLEGKEKRNPDKDSSENKSPRAKGIRTGNRTPKSRRPLSERAKEALKIEAKNPYEEALQYFIGRGQLHPTGIIELFGGGRKKVTGEHRSRIGYINKVGLTIEQIAHKLWEDRLEGDERYDTQDFRNAVEDVIRNHNSSKSMIEELLELNKQKIEEDYYYTDLPIEHEYMDKAHDYWEELSEEEKAHLANDAEENVEQFYDANPYKEPTAGEVKAQAEYDAGLIDIETRLSEAKQAKQNKLNKLNKNTDLFVSEAKTDELFGSDQDLSPENIKEQLKPFDEKISLLEKEKNDFIGNKEEFLKKHEGQAEIGEEERLTGLRKIADDIRNGKIDDDITMAGVPFAKEVWNAALEATATALEAGADIADAIKDGIAYIKNTDWYKNLSAEDQAKAESKFDKEMNSRPLTEEEKRVVTEEVNKGYNKKESEWLGNKEYDEHKASVEADNLQTEIKNTVPRNKSESELSYKKRWTKTDQAIHVYLDLKAKPEDLAKFYDKLTPEQKEIVDLSQNLTPEQKAIAEKISTEYQKTGQEALDAGQIKNILDNYVARSWDFKGKPPTDIAPFKTSTRHNLQRTLTSILEGWSKGYDLKLKGATTNLQTLKVEIGHAIENKNFIEQGSKIKTAEGEPLFSTHQAEGYEKIDNPSFKKWEYAGKVNDFTADQIQVFGKRKDILITTDGTVMKKSDVYAPKDVAKGLNNILGKSFLNNFAAVRAISNFSNAVKSTLFGTSFFHHAAFARAHMLASENTGLGDISPRAAYKKGQQLIHEFSPEVKMLVENGLTLGKQQEYDEVINENKSLLSRKMDKYNFAPKQREYLSDLSERQNRFLFEKYGAGLKAFDGINMLRKLAKDKPEIDITEHAQNVARFLNQNYGGLNLKRMKRNPTTQHAMRLLLLAPDWTESNLQMAADAFRKGTMGDFSRKMWGRVAMRGMAAVTLANLVTTMGDQKDDNGKDISFADAIKRRYKKAWDEGRLRFLEWDITPIIRSMGGQEDKRYYFSFYGHFSDPIKMISNPTDFLENKLNPSVTKPGFEALTGENWKHEKFTKFSELMGIDDKGIYSKSQKAHEKGQIGMTGKPYKRDAKEFKKGEEKGGKLIGHLTSRSYEPHGGIGLEEAPSFALSQARGMIPTQVQNLEMWATGENDAVYSIAQSLGLGLKISSDKKDEELKKKK